MEENRDTRLPQHNFIIGYASFREFFRKKEVVVSIGIVLLLVVSVILYSNFFAGNKTAKRQGSGGN